MDVLCLLDVYGRILFSIYLFGGKDDSTVLVSKHLVSRSEIDPCND